MTYSYSTELLSNELELANYSQVAFHNCCQMKYVMFKTEGHRALAIVF